MARRRPTQPPPAPPPEPLEARPLTFGEQLHLSVTGRADRIRAARARTPPPTYEEIAAEVGCCVKTVYNVLKAGGEARG